jgi:hypothetical protein
MRVARVEVAPSIKNSDDRFVAKIIIRPPHRLNPRPMPMCPHIIGREPPRTAKILNIFS